MKCTCDCSCDSCYDSDTPRAQLAAVEKERDYYRDTETFLTRKIDSLAGERDAANERVKALEENLKQALSDLAFVDRALVAEVKSHAAARDLAEKLEAALEPTAEGRQEYVVALMASADFDETEDAIVAMDGLLHAIRARAGLTKEGT